MKHRLLLFLLCLSPFLIFGSSFDLKETRDVATTEGLPSNLMNQSVCVISGAYTDSILDMG
jgi:hypothetical protein